MTARPLDTGSHGPYASRQIATACQARMDVVPARSGLCSKAGLARLGQDALEGTKIRAHASKCMAMRDRRMKQAAPARGCAAGWGHAQATPLGDDPRRAPTRADAGSPQSQPGPTGSGDAGDGSEHNLKAVHRGRGCRRAQAHTEDARPRDEDPPGTRRTSQALSATNARERTRVWPAHPGS